jgi:hypothetical protein
MNSGTICANAASYVITACVSDAQCGSGRFCVPSGPLCGGVTACIAPCPA